MLLARQYSDAMCALLIVIDDQAINLDAARAAFVAAQDAIEGSNADLQFTITAGHLVSKVGLSSGQWSPRRSLSHNPTFWLIDATRLLEGRYHDDAADPVFADFVQEDTGLGEAWTGVPDSVTAQTLTRLEAAYGFRWGGMRIVVDSHDVHLNVWHKHAADGLGDFEIDLTDFVRAARQAVCQHEADPQTVQSSRDGIIDVACIKCGASGSFLLPSINW